MDPQFKTSFIPKKNLAPKQTRKKSFGVSGLLSLISAVLVGGILVLAGLTFLYQQYLERTIEQKKQELAVQQERFQPALIDSLLDLDARLRAAETILNNHVAPSQLFALLERTTLQSVQFTSFQYSDNGGRIGLTLDGRSRSFSTVALQSESFGAERSLRDQVFAGLNLDAEGNVIFSFNATVDPRLVSYSDLVRTGGASIESEESAFEESSTQ